MSALLEKMRLAGMALRRRGLYEAHPVMIRTVPPGITYPRGDRAVRQLVVGRIRELLRGDRGADTLAIFFHFGHKMVAGEREERNVRIEYGMGGNGPYREVYWRQHNKPKSPWRIRQVDAISPEELLVYVKHPQEFYDSILRFLDVAAGKVLAKVDTEDAPAETQSDTDERSEK